MSEKMYQKLDEMAVSEIKKSVYTKEEIGRKGVDKLLKMFGISTNWLVRDLIPWKSRSKLLSNYDIAKTLMKYHVVDNIEDAYKETEIFLKKGIGDTSTAHCSWEGYETKDKKKLFRLQFYSAPPNPFTGF
jgi:hypothetical protein